MITDYPDAHVIDNLQRNLDLALLPRSSGKKRELNPHYREARERVQVLGLGWGNADEEERVFAASSPSNPNARDGYDIVLAADVLWVSSAHPLLIHSIRRLLKRDRAARCVLIAGFHTGRPAVRRFFIQLAEPADEGDATLEHERRAGMVPDWQESCTAASGSATSTDRSVLGRVRPCRAKRTTMRRGSSTKMRRETRTWAISATAAAGWSSPRSAGPT